jgi:hypothetical protein
MLYRQRAKARDVIIGELPPNNHSLFTYSLPFRMAIYVVANDERGYSNGRIKMPIKRDYKAEYKRRIQRGLIQGLSLSEARGHGKPRSSGAEQKTEAFKFDRQLEEGLKTMRGGKSLSKAAKSIHVAPERLRNYIEQAGVAEKKSGRWRIGDDSRKFDVLIHSKGKTVKIIVRYKESQKAGAYMSAVGNFLTSNDPSKLEPFVGEYLIDLKGKKHLLETRPNVLYRLTAAQNETFEEAYRIAA